MDKMEKMRLSPKTCVSSAATCFEYVAAMQNEPWIGEAAEEAATIASELFGKVWAVNKDRMRHLAVMSYIAMDIAANVSHVIDRVEVAVFLDEWGENGDD